MTDLQQQIKTALKGNAFRFGSNREIRRLPQYLQPGEKVLSIVTGSRHQKRGRGIVVATDQRVLFIWDGWVFRENQDFPYETISSMEFQTGVFFGIMTLYGKGDEISYNWIDRFSGDRFTKLVRQLAADDLRKRDENHSNHNNSPGQFPVQQSPSTGPDIILKQIEDLGSLRDRGYITPEDYSMKKAELLNRL